MSAGIKILRAGVRKFRSQASIYGFRSSLVQTLRQLLRIEVMIRFEKNLRTPEAKIAPKIPLEIIPLQGDVDLDLWGIRQEILKIRGPFGLDQFKDRLAGRDILFCACTDGRLAGFIWLKSFPVTGAGYQLKEDEGYYIDGWTFEPYRGKGVLPALEQAVFDYVRSHFPQIRILIAHAGASNKPSLVGQQRAGLMIVARELSIVFFGVNRKFRLKTIPKPTK